RVGEACGPPTRTMYWRAQAPLKERRGNAGETTFIFGSGSTKATTTPLTRRALTCAGSAQPSVGDVRNELPTRASRARASRAQTSRAGPRASDDPHTQDLAGPDASIPPVLIDRLRGEGWSRAIR